MPLFLRWNEALIIKATCLLWNDVYQNAHNFIIQETIICCYFSREGFPGIHIFFKYCQIFMIILHNGPQLWVAYSQRYKADPPIVGGWREKIPRECLTTYKQTTFREK